MKTLKQFQPKILAAAVLIGLSGVSGSVFAAQGSPGGGQGGGNKPPVETSNNLSYPTQFTEPSSLLDANIGTYNLSATYPAGMSYGCLKPETIGTTTYKNTSCVDDNGTPITQELCIAPGGKCEGFSVEELEPIYWQKNSSNTWQAGFSDDVGTASVDYVDWGDNLEGRTWPVQVLRVETNTFNTVDPTVRFDMWHVFGAGTNELWGAHATNDKVPYVYSTWAFAVNNSPKAKLNIAKLLNGRSTCPTVATGLTQSPFGPDALGWVKNAEGVGSWNGTWVLYDALYGAELNIKGSYVYGYNWNLRSAIVPGDVNKAGWWRLTFYTTDNSIDFSTWKDPTAAKNTLAPPDDTTLTPAPIEIAAAEEGETGLLLYVPQVDKTNNLTYLDICISETKGGSGGKKGGGK